MRPTSRINVISESSLKAEMLLEILEPGALVRQKDKNKRSRSYISSHPLTSSIALDDRTFEFWNNFPLRADTVRNCVMPFYAVDGYILILVKDEPLPDHLADFLNALHFLGMPPPIIFLDTAEHPETEEECEPQISQLHSLFIKSGFKVNQLPIVVGRLDEHVDKPNTHKANQLVAKTIEALCGQILKQPIIQELPLLLQIEYINEEDPEKGALYGKIIRGCINTGDIVDIIGNNTRKSCKVKSLIMFQKKYETLNAGYSPILYFENLKGNDLSFGQCITTPNAKTHTKFRGLIYFLTQEQGGLVDPIMMPLQCRIYITGHDIMGKVFKTKNQPCNHDRIISVDVSLSIETIAQPQDWFFIRDHNKKTIAAGSIVSIFK